MQNHLPDARKPTYDQLSALCAQMAAALEECNKEAVMSNNIIRMGWPSHGQGRVKIATSLHRVEKQSEKALTAYSTLSPDPVWQRVPGGCVVVPEEPDLTMCSAGKTAINPKLENAEGVPYARRVYRAMLAVRPKNRARGEG